MKKFVVILIIIIAGYGSHAAAADINLKYACHTYASDDFARLVTDPLFTAISKATGGQVSVNAYYYQSLLMYDEVWDGLAAGSADIGLVISGFYYGRTLLSHVMDLPTLPQNANAADHAGAMWRIYEKYAEVQDEYIKQGIRPLVFISLGQKYLFTNKPVSCLEDLKDIALLSDNPMTIKQFELFDAGDIHFGQLYEILHPASQTAFGCIAPLENFILWNMHEITPYATVAPLSRTYIVIAMSEKRWQALPPDIREQIMDACGEHASSRLSAAYANHFLDAATADSNGPTFISLSPEERQRWIELNQPLVDEWQAACAEKGFGLSSRLIYADLQQLK